MWQHSHVQPLVSCFVISACDCSLSTLDLSRVDDDFGGTPGKHKTTSFSNSGTKQSGRPWENVLCQLFIIMLLCATLHIPSKYMIVLPLPVPMLWLSQWPLNVCRCFPLTYLTLYSCVIAFANCSYSSSKILKYNHQELSKHLRLC